MAIEIEIGARFGRLEVIGLAPRKGSDRALICRCECGVERSFRIKNLRAGTTRSCGCLAQEFIGEHLNKFRTKHGHAKKGNLSPTFNTWNGMIGRCKNPKSNRFDLYGGRGIRVCEQWQSFEGFLADMGVRPAGKTLDRINSDGNYESGNCRWATVEEQNKNKRKWGVTITRSLITRLEEASAEHRLIICQKICPDGWAIVPTGTHLARATAALNAGLER